VGWVEEFGTLITGKKKKRVGGNPKRGGWSKKGQETSKGGG